MIRCGILGLIVALTPCPRRQARAEPTAKAVLPLAAAADKSGRGGKQTQGTVNRRGEGSGGAGGGGDGGGSGKGPRRKRWRPEELDPMIAAEDAELKVRSLPTYPGKAVRVVLSGSLSPPFRFVLNVTLFETSIDVPHVLVLPVVLPCTLDVKRTQGCGKVHCDVLG